MTTQAPEQPIATGEVAETTTRPAPTADTSQVAGGTAGAATGASPESQLVVDTTPAPQGPYDLPSDFKFPQAPTAAQGPITDNERHQLDYYRQRDQQNVLRDHERALDDYERQAVRYYMEREGQDEQVARMLATAHRTERQASLQREMELRGTLQAQQVVGQQAAEVARQFNVNPAVLVGFRSRDEMARHAAVVRSFGEYRQTMEKRVAALEKARVPEQQFASGGPGVGSPGSNSYVERLKSGKPLPTAAEIDRMTARFAPG